MKNLIPKFDDYICVGDSVRWEQDGFAMEATVEHDGDIHVSNYDCYSKIKINQWLNDEWYFGVIEITASKCGVELATNYLGGVEINYNKKANRQLNGHIFEMDTAEEAIAEAKLKVADLQNVSIATDEPMTQADVDRFEEIKKKLTDDYSAAIDKMYRAEVVKAMIWFKDKYPKRTLEWKSGMGTCFWVLDDEILHWDSLILVFTNSCWDLHYEQTKPCRIANKLLPLWFVYQSMMDMSNVCINNVDTCDVTMEQAILEKISDKLSILDRAG